MFGKGLEVPKRNTRVYKKMPPDILLPSPTPAYYQHIARNPNTNYHVEMLHYKQRRNAADDFKTKEEAALQLSNRIFVKYDQHAEKKKFQNDIHNRVLEKLKAYEESVEQRRNKLRDLLCREERQYYYETIDNAQKGQEEKMQEMKIRAEKLKAKREEERLEIVKQKRVEQYRQRCQELRPALEKKNLIETKKTQLQQMRENEARREADRELEKMWHEVLLKDVLAKAEREEQEVLKENLKNKDIAEVWKKQVKGKELLKEEVAKIALEDRLEMEKLSEQMRREEIEALDAKRRKRDKTARELLEQIAVQEELMTQRAKEETALEEAFSKLTQMEIEREKQAQKDSTLYAMREAALYRKHLKQLEQERKKEEEELNKLLEMHQKEIQKKQDEAKCKIVEAKRKLQEDVLRGRAEQLEWKRQEAENQLKLKEAENELLRMAFETNERLQAEHERLAAEAVKQYRDDLGKQIEYNDILRQREREELERQLQEGLREEEKFRKIVEDMITAKVEMGMKHPFRRVLESFDCRCPPPNPLPN